MKYKNIMSQRDMEEAKEILRRFASYRQRIDATKIDENARSTLIELLRTGEALVRRIDRARIFSMYPQGGPHRRELYPKHMEFFNAGSKYRERGFMAGNRIGKTWGAGGYETVLHLTGRYPEWWGGRRFSRPISGWAAGTTNETTRDIIQRKLLGVPGQEGTGLIPGHLIHRTTPRQGVPNAVETIYVKHIKMNGISELGLKSYKMGRQAFEGTERDVIWLDEEPPEDIYGECLIRTMTTNGLVYITFTPLEGITPVVVSFLPKRDRPYGVE